MVIIISICDIFIYDLLLMTVHSVKVAKFTTPYSVA